MSQQRLASERRVILQEVVNISDPIVFFARRHALCSVISLVSIHTQDLDKLLDFNYVDEDISSLRKQMQLPHEASPLSDELFPSPGICSEN